MTPTPRTLTAQARVQAEVGAGWFGRYGDVQRQSAEIKQMVNQQLGT